MDEDDEFGDLYTDVLLPFATESSPSVPHTSSAPSSIDLNQIPSAASHSINDQILPTQDEPPVKNDDEESPDDGVRVLLEPADKASSLDSKPLAVDVVFEGNNDPMDQDDVKFDIEDEDDGVSEPVIPGLSGGQGVEDGGGYDRGGNDDWDSDSDDDLQIVLNDDKHLAMDKGGLVDDDEDDDGGLVIVTGEPSQGLEEQEWVENANVPLDGERKDVTEPGKAVIGPGGVPVVPKIGFGSHIHGYHPFHSQFK
ncbi:hypothetical protein L195_g043772, partial [Trifolium pratense]